MKNVQRRRRIIRRPADTFFIESSDDPAVDLILLDALEQRLEVSLAEPFVALALDQLEEDRPDHRLREDLQQHARLAAFDHAFAVDQEPELAQAIDRLAVPGQALVDLRVVRVRRRRHERHAAGKKLLHRLVDVVATAGNMLDAFAAVVAQVFLDLAAIVRALVDRDADLPSGLVSALLKSPVSLPSMSK